MLKPFNAKVIIKLASFKNQLFAINILVVFLNLAPDLASPAQIHLLDRQTGTGLLGIEFRRLPHLLQG